MDNEDIQRHADAILGEAAHEWWNSDLGKYIIGRSFQETERIRTELGSVDPEDSKKIRELQNAIKIAEKALIWMNEQIETGREALQQLDMEDDENA